MPNTASKSKRGRIREVKVVDLLEANGWTAVRAASGPVDVVAIAGVNAVHPTFGRLIEPADLRLRGHCTVWSWRPILVQVKSTAGGPYKQFLPKHRRELAAMAEKSGSAAWLVWWPPGAPPRWIPEEDWPGAGA